MNFNDKKPIAPSNKPDLVLNIPEPEPDLVLNTNAEKKCPDCNKKGFSVAPPISTSEPRTTSRLNTAKPTKQTTVISRSPPWPVTMRPVSNFERGKCVGVCPSPDYPYLVYLSHENCNKYCFCGLSGPIVLHCSPHLVFDPRNQICGDPKKISCVNYFG